MNIPIDKIRDKRILVVGDLMLDIYLRGTANRISPEAPVPVVSAERRDLIPGGAANVMANLKSLGCFVAGAGYLGQDDEGHFLHDSLEKLKVDTQLIFWTDLPTIHKTRVIANGQHVVRYDFDTDFKQLDSKVKEEMSSYIVASACVNKFDAIIVSDYNKGTITSDIMKSIINTFKCPVICDIKPLHKELFSDVWCITPNLLEAQQMIGDTSGSIDPFIVARKLKKDMRLQSIVVTLADKGILLIDENNEEVLFDAYTKMDEHDPTQRFDVTGAGDTVISIFTACLAAGIKTKNAVYAANVAAGIVVNKIGTAICSHDELVHELSKEKNNGWSSS